MYIYEKESIYSQCRDPFVRAAVCFKKTTTKNSLQFLEPFKASRHVLSSCLEVLELCDPVAASGGVQGPDGKWSPDALRHFSEKGLHGCHLSLVDHEPPSSIERVSILIHHHALNWRQDGRSCCACRHL